MKVSCPIKHQDLGLMKLQKLRNTVPVQLSGVELCPKTSPHTCGNFLAKVNCREVGRGSLFNKSY